MSERKTSLVAREPEPLQINVQADGIRPVPSAHLFRGEREKSRQKRRRIRWLEERTVSESTRCGELLDKYLDRVKATTSRANWRPMEYRINTARPINHRPQAHCKLTEEDLQATLDAGYSAAIKT